MPLQNHLRADFMRQRSNQSLFTLYQKQSL